MVNLLSFCFEQCFARLPCYLSKRPTKQNFLDFYLTTFFRVPKFKAIPPMTVIFFLKMLKIESKFLKWKKKENIFRFWDNSIWKCCYKLSLLRWEHVLSVVNGLTNNPKIVHITQIDFFNLNCFHSDQ